MFDTVSHFNLGVIFACKAGAYQSGAALWNYSLMVGSQPCLQKLGYGGSGRQLCLHSSLSRQRNDYDLESFIVQTLGTSFQL